MRTLRFALTWCAGLLLAVQAYAHEMPKSAVLLDFRSQEVELELQLPIDRLQVALRHDGSEDAPDAVAMLGLARARVASYILNHVGATTGEGAPWSVRLLDLRGEMVDGVEGLVAQLTLGPPAGAPADVIRLRYDVITRELVTHAVLVSVRTDWRSGISAGAPELLGAMSARRTELLVDRSGGSAWRGFRRIFALGMDHIAEGTDHLLFLLTLLLPASLLAMGGRWNGSKGAVRSVVQVVKIVSAFTIGHSLTLLIGALGIVRVPEPPIEVLIAASILISAIHALRPIFPGREFVIAGGFGLVHGLAFATVISELGLDRWGMALGILAFNIGIEVMQLAVVLAVMPWLLLLSTTRAYPVFRVLGACFAAVAATGWMAERALGWANPIDPAVDAVASHALWVVTLLTVAAVIAKAVQAVSRRLTRVERDNAMTIRAPEMLVRGSVDGVGMYGPDARDGAKAARRAPAVTARP